MLYSGLLARWFDVFRRGSIRVAPQFLPASTKCRRFFLVVGHQQVTTHIHASTPAAREILFALRVSTSQAESIWCCFFSCRFCLSAARLAQCSGASVGFSIATLITRLNSSASPHRNFSGTQRQVVSGFPRVHNARNGLFANARIRRMRPRRALFISQLGETCSFSSDLSFLGRMRRRNAPRCKVRQWRTLVPTLSTD